MSSTRFIRAWRFMAATVPTRWPVPRFDEGRSSAAAGGSRGLAIRCSCRVDLLCRPAELAAVAQHAMEDDRELAGHGDGGLPGADPPAPSTCAAEVEAIRAAWAGRHDGYAKAAMPVPSAQV